MLKKRKKNLETKRKLYTLKSPKSSISEAYRMFRTNLKYLNIDGQCKSIMLTSSAPAEGKSLTTANLAVTMAQAGKKVLVMDGDLRKPVQHEIFEVDKNLGFTAYLSGEGSLSEFIQATEIKNLDVLSAGPIPPNPAELLVSGKAKEAFKKLKAEYDYVLIDTPPITVVSDALILAENVDGAILVANSGLTKVVALEESQSFLKKSGVKILGVVLNNISSNGHYYNYRRYGKYYYRAYSKYYEE